jgi:hypothetical protein
MKPNTARLLRALFYVYVAVTFLHLAYVVHHEPFAFDAWNVSVDTKAKPITIGRFFEFWHQQYTTSNPRIGQPLAYLAYKVDGFAEIGTPLAFFAIVLAAFVLGAGRWPSRKNDRDLAILAIGIGFMWFVSPNFPAYMFCRAYATNYVWAIAFQLWFLVPLRLHASGVLLPASTPKLVGYALFGVVAGMCNEHTGPTLLLFALAYAAWATRKQRPNTRILWAGTAGALVGYALVFFAPGQGQRYEGLAERYSLTQQILVRGFTGNIDIFLDFLEAAAPLLILTVAAIVIGMVTNRTPREELEAERDGQRRAFGFFGLVLLAGVLITITVFASPKLGPRFYMHSMTLLLAGTLGVLFASLRRPKAFAPFVVFALIASTYAAARTIPLYTKMSNASDKRLSGLAATPLGGVYTAEAWQPVPETWWALGDDARDQKKQELIAKYFGLSRVVFRGSDQWKTLGVTDVRLTMDYEFDRPLCVDEVEQLDLKPFVGRDIGAIHHAFIDAITEIELATKQKPRSIDLKVIFLGAQPEMPKKRLYIARWNAGELEGYTARLSRAGRSTQRRIVLSDRLKKEPWDMYLVRVGDAPKRLGTNLEADKLAYVPWTSGEYWTLACKPDYCFVVLAVTHAL